ncbi:hypothetical protein HZA97_01900 [Candidatus Woesearchaeota archaeon]|nr:hypothetical protein [Candidatus Woesearchaeota archaeon]
MTNYQWYLESDLDIYSGNWVAILNKKVIATSKDLKELTEKISQKFSLTNVSFVKIPGKEEALVYY